MMTGRGLMRLAGQRSIKARLIVSAFALAMECANHFFAKHFSGN